MGLNDGLSDGLDVGRTDGFNVGFTVGSNDGLNVGLTDGCLVGSDVRSVIQQSPWSMNESPELLLIPFSQVICTCDNSVFPVLIQTSFGIPLKVLIVTCRRLPPSLTSIIHEAISVSLYRLF